jgi:hypothetical protein
MATVSSSKTNGANSRAARRGAGVEASGAGAGRLRLVPFTKSALER